MLVLMHGCCAGNKTSWEATTFDGADAGGEKWHYNNAWFAARGYVVVTYTARGFVNGQNGDGSTGQTAARLASVRDQRLPAPGLQTVGAASEFNPVTGRNVAVNPKRVVDHGRLLRRRLLLDGADRPEVGLHARHRRGQTAMSLAAAAPKYGWTDLAYSLVPTGTHEQEPGALPAFNGCDSAPQFDGSPARSEDAGRDPEEVDRGRPLRQREDGDPAGNDHTTFPPAIDEAFTCLEGPYPPEQNPALRGDDPDPAARVPARALGLLPERLLPKIATDPSYRIPVFNAASFTDPLFPPSENRRMVNRLRSVVPNYPIQVFYGDYQHFVQNKAKEWGDICQSGSGPRHVCAARPTIRPATTTPTRRTRFAPGSRPASTASSTTTRSPPAIPPSRGPPFNVTARFRSARRTPAPGPPTSRARPLPPPTFEQLAPNTLDLNLTGSQTTTSDVEPNPHAANSDPVANFAANGGRCPVETQPAGSGVAVYTSAPLARPQTMIGATRVTFHFSASPGATGVRSSTPASTTSSRRHGRDGRPRPAPREQRRASRPARSATSCTATGGASSRATASASSSLRTTTRS